mgnify:CR=1 FL=1
MSNGLNTCKSLGDFINEAINIHREKGISLTIEQAFREGIRLKRLWYGETQEKED